MLDAAERFSVIIHVLIIFGLSKESEIRIKFAFLLVFLSNFSKD